MAGGAARGAAGRAPSTDDQGGEHQWPALIIAILV
jgi:hypothetical protein